MSRILAAGAQAPVGNFCGNYRVTGRVGRGEARGVTDGAIDIFDRSALRAHEVVVVVSRSPLISRGGARGFDPAEKASLAQAVQHVVDRLHRKRRQGCSHCREKRLGVAVRHGLKRLQKGYSAARHAEPGIPEFSRKSHGHSDSLSLIVNDSK